MKKTSHDLLRLSTKNIPFIQSRYSHLENQLRGCVLQMRWNEIIRSTNRKFSNHPGVKMAHKTTVCV